MNNKKILFAAGGTGGHLFPATAVAEALQERYKNSIECIFIGTEKKIESEKIPELGYEYHSMPITGFPGKNLKAFKYPFQLIRSISIARKVIKSKGIDAVVCTGAYLSLPPGYAARREKTPLFLMESNVNPGKAIKFLAPHAAKIYTSYEESSEYFNFDFRNKITAFGNPVRKTLTNLPNKNVSLTRLGLKEGRKTLLIFGGSLGAKSINKVVESKLKKLSDLKINIIWQTGKRYITPATLPENVKAVEFISDMATAYSTADLVICRSGATTVSELAVTKKPSILIPFPAASNNEQLRNAEIFEKAGAAKILKDEELGEKLYEQIEQLIFDDSQLSAMSEKLSEFAKPKAAENIADDIINYLN